MIWSSGGPPWLETCPPRTFGGFANGPNPAGNLASWSYWTPTWKDDILARPNPIWPRRRRSKKYHVSLMAFQSTNLSSLSPEPSPYIDAYLRSERDVHAGENHSTDIENLYPDQVNIMRDWTLNGSHRDYWVCEENWSWMVMVTPAGKVTHLDHVSGLDSRYGSTLW